MRLNGYEGWSGALPGPVRRLDCVSAPCVSINASVLAAARSKWPCGSDDSLDWSPVSQVQAKGNCMAEVVVLAGFRNRLPASVVVHEA